MKTKDDDANDFGRRFMETCAASLRPEEENRWQPLLNAEEEGEDVATEMVAFDDLFWAGIYVELAGRQTEKRVRAFKRIYWRPEAVRAREKALFGEVATRCNYLRLDNVLFLLATDSEDPRFRRYAARRGYHLAPPPPPPIEVGGELRYPTPLPGPPESEGYYYIYTGDYSGTSKASDILVFGGGDGSGDGTADDGPRRRLHSYEALDLEIGRLIREGWENAELYFFTALEERARELLDSNQSRPGPKKGHSRTSKAAESRPQVDQESVDPGKTGLEPHEFFPPRRLLKLSGLETAKGSILRELKCHLLEHRMIPTGSELIKRLYGRGPGSQTQKGDARDYLREMGIPLKA